MNASQKKIAVARAAVAGLVLLGAQVPQELRAAASAEGAALVAMSQPVVAVREVNRYFPGTFAEADLDRLPDLLPL